MVQLVLKGMFVANIAHTPKPHIKCSTSIQQNYFKNGRYCGFLSEQRKVQLKKERNNNLFFHNIQHDALLMKASVITETMYANAIMFIAGAHKF